MDTSLLTAFLPVSLGVIAIPGPNVLVIVSTSVLHGKRRGLQTVAGTSLAMAIQLFVVGIGTSWFISVLTDGLSLLKWLGVAYLCYLGLMHLKKAMHREEVPLQLSASASFVRGFTVSLTNPKTMLFFSAFLPQFVSSPEHYAFQISFLSITFLLMAVLLDSCYAIFTVRLKSILGDWPGGRIRDAVSSLLFLGAGAWLAASRRL